MAISVFDFMSDTEIADVQSVSPMLDHTSSFNAALDAANLETFGGNDLNQTGSAVLGIPRGRYRVTGLTIPFGVSLSGESEREMVIEHIGKGVAVDTSHKQHSRKIAAMYERFSIVGNKNTTIALDIYTPYISSISNIRVMTSLDLAGIPSGSIGIRVRTETTPSLRETYFNEFYNVLAHAFDIGFLVTDVANSNQFFGCSTHTTPKAGFKVENSGRIRIYGHSSEQAGTHISVGENSGVLIAGWDAENSPNE